MEEILDLYVEPYDAEKPVVCFDECSKELHGEVTEPIPPAPGQPAKQDYDDNRIGTTQLGRMGARNGDSRRTFSQYRE